LIKISGPKLGVTCIPSADDLNDEILHILQRNRRLDKLSPSRRITSNS
jgi:hypothetical protein